MQKTNKKEYMYKQKSILSFWSMYKYTFYIIMYNFIAIVYTCHILDSVRPTYAQETRFYKILN